MPYCRLPNRLAIAAMSILLAWPAGASAQQGFADAMSGFSRDSNAPIEIEADNLEVRDAEKRAIFSGNVKVQQGDVAMQTRELVVYYTGSAQGAGDQDIDRLEASGGVVVTSGDQKATGASGTFDAARDLITLEGDVVLTQGTNVLQGRKLVVDLAKGTSRVYAEDGATGSGRVKGLFTPNRGAPAGN